MASKDFETMRGEQGKQSWMLADTLQVDIVCAEGTIFSGRAKMVVVPAAEGDVGILPGHTEMLTSVKSGEVRLLKSDSSEEDYYISGGFLEVQPEVVTVLADTIIRAEDIDEKMATEAKEKAEKIISTKQYDNYTTALIELSRAIAQLKIAKKGRK